MPMPMIGVNEFETIVMGEVKEFFRAVRSGENPNVRRISDVPGRAHAIEELWWTMLFDYLNGIGER